MPSPSIGSRNSWLAVFDPVLRYRSFEIDRSISRTVTYPAVVGLVGWASVVTETMQPDRVGVWVRE